MSSTISKTLLVFAAAVIPAFCSFACAREKQQQRTAEFFVPQGAQRVKQAEQQEVAEITYDLAQAYPASAFLCELSAYLNQRQWRGLREDALNPGSESSLVKGWGDYENGTRQPATHVHIWMSQWMNEKGDMLTYALQYEYPESAKPDLSILSVSAAMWPASVVRAQLGARAEQLRTLFMPVGAGGNRLQTAGDQCAPQWSDFVKSKSASGPPALGLPYELSGVRSILIGSDVDGLAVRIAQALTKQIPTLQVITVHDRGSVAPDAILDFRSECRCKQPGTPDGLFTREAVLYKPEIQKASASEPARVLFYWSDSGEPTWKKQVPRECFGEKTISVTCKASFDQADIAFTESLAAALIQARDQR